MRLGVRGAGTGRDSPVLVLKGTRGQRQSVKSTRTDVSGRPDVSTPPSSFPRNSQGEESCGVSRGPQFAAPSTLSLTRPRPPWGPEASGRPRSPVPRLALWARGGTQTTRRRTPDAGH